MSRTPKDPTPWATYILEDWVLVGRPEPHAHAALPSPRTETWTRQWRHQPAGVQQTQPSPDNARGPSAEKEAELYHSHLPLFKKG